jgi:iron only hydrogenase large subunit-like protein
MEKGKQFMTSSCCPAYMLAVKKHLNKLQEYVSSTPSPMIFTGQFAKKITPIL